MATRWHCPPENSWGRLSAARAGIDADLLEQPVDDCPLLRLVAALPDRQAARERVAQVRRGLRAAIGSWKIICMPVRAARIALASRPVRSRPSNHTGTAVGGGSCITARASDVLPHPDSPTTPSVSPRSTSRLIPATALTMSPVRPIGNSTTTSSTRGARRRPIRAQVGGAAAGHQPPLGSRPRPGTSRRTGARASRRPSKGGASAWHRSRAYRHRGREGAAGRRVDEVGRASGDGSQPGVRCRLDRRDALQQRLGVGHPDVGEQRLRRRPFDDPTGVHHDDVVGVSGDHAEVVGDEHDRHVAVAALLADEVEDLRLHRDVERRRRLVGEQQLRSAGEGDGDHHPLTHPAGQLVRVLAHPPRRLRDAHIGEQALGRRRGVAAGHPEVAAQRFGDLVTDPHQRVQRAHRVLEHHRHRRAPQAARSCPSGRPISSSPSNRTEPERTTSGPDEQAHDRAAEHGLARP